MVKAYVVCITHLAGNHIKHFVATTNPVEPNLIKISETPLGCGYSLLEDLWQQVYALRTNHFKGPISDELAASDFMVSRLNLYRKFNLFETCISIEQRDSGSFWDAPGLVDLLLATLSINPLQMPALSIEQQVVHLEKAKRIQQMPAPIKEIIDKLSCHERGICYDGKPLAQCKRHIRLQAYVALTLLQPHHYKRIRLPDLTMLNALNRSPLSEYIKRAGYQIWIGHMVPKTTKQTQSSPEFDDAA